MNTEIQIEQLFEKWWRDLESAHFSNLGNPTNEQDVPKRSARELLAEIAVRLRSSRGDRAAPRGVVCPSKLDDRSEALLGTAKSLTSEQRALLSKLATAKRYGMKSRVNMILEAAEEDDLRALAEHGFVYRTGGGENRMRKPVAELFGETLFESGA